MSELFGTLADGTPVHRWTLERAGVRVRVLTYGGIVQSAEVPDRDGRTADVVLGFAELEGYLDHSGPYLGAFIGRYANRIAGGRFDGNAVFDYRFGTDQLSHWDWFHPSRDGQARLAEIAYRTVTAREPVT